MSKLQLLPILLLSFSAVCAQKLPIDLNNGWELSWNDEFDYTNEELDKNWESQNSVSGGFVIGGRWRENAVVNNGIVELLAKKDYRAGEEWSTGSIWTKRTFHYGYYECRYKYAAASGTNNSFWMWPRSGVPEGEKKYELDVNEGHYPNEINTNIHNWTDVAEDGTHQTWQQAFVVGAEQQEAYTHVFEQAIKASKIRFSSNHLSHFHIGEFRIYAPNTLGFPQDATSNNADTEVAGLTNYARASTTIITSSGQYVVDGRNTDASNVANGLNTGANASWIAPATGEKWLEFDMGAVKQVGCIQFTNGWKNGDVWKDLITHYKIEYFNGTQWLPITEYDQTGGNDFSEEYHTYGMLWTENEVSYYFDGELLRTHKHIDIVSPTHIYLSLAILSGNIAGAVTDAIDGTSMKVDYVRFYEFNGKSAVNKTKQNKSKVYPNPISQNQSLKIEPIDHSPYSVNIYKINGQLIYTENEIINNHEITINNLSKGMYITKICNNTTSEVHNIVVQ